MTFLWTPTHEHICVGRPARSYIDKLCADTRYSLEGLSGAMKDSNGYEHKKIGR